MGDSFFIILKGKVSVWTPVSSEEMRRPLQLLRDHIKRRAGKTEELNFSFQKSVILNDNSSFFSKKKSKHLEISEGKKQTIKSNYSSSSDQSDEDEDT